jgi:hypothetical protein
MRHPFEQSERESGKAFAAFSLYLSLGPDRSIAAVAQKLSKSIPLLKRWSVRFDWGGRVAAHAAHLAVVEREATEAVARGKAAEWMQRQVEQREAEWLLRGELIAAGRKVLERFKDGSRGATLGDAARALEIASKLGRLAAGMATEKTEVAGEDGGPIRVELEAALKKVYGDQAAVAVVDVEAEPVKPAALMQG